LTVSRFVTIVAAAFAICAGTAPAQTSTAPAGSASLREVVIISRHGVRSPTDPSELAPYSARPWPGWEVPPGNLTPHGFAAEKNLGAAFRALYAASGLLPRNGCPAPDLIYVWTDVEQRTMATGSALLEGLAPHCGLGAHDLGAAVDPLFHALPSLGVADSGTASAALSGSIGAVPQALVPAYGLAFARLDAILGCDAAKCQRISQLPVSLEPASKTGLASVRGAVDLASSSVESFILAYADGKPFGDVAWGSADPATLLDLSQIHVLKVLLDSETPYAAGAQGSNLLAHVLATLDQGATGRPNRGTRAPLAARFVAFVGHDTNLAAIAGVLRLRWLLPGYQLNDTPPGGALLFEVRQASSGAEPFVRAFYTAQSLDEMRTLSTNAPERAPVFVPGCPALDCPLATFERVVNTAIDPAFVGTW
jgi:4-phytase/acid phosphatase